MELNIEQNNIDLQNKIANHKNDHAISPENSNSPTKESSTNSIEPSVAEAKELLQKSKDFWKNHKIEEVDFYFEF